MDGLDFTKGFGLSLMVYVTIINITGANLFLIGSMTIIAFCRGNVLLSLYEHYKYIFLASITVTFLYKRGVRLFYTRSSSARPLI